MDSQDAPKVQEYEVVAFVGDGLIMVEGKYGRQVWVRGVKVLNTVKMCEMCGMNLYHQIAYRPINNPVNRASRICLNCVDTKMQVKPGQKIPSPELDTSA